MARCAESFPDFCDLSRWKTLGGTGRQTLTKGQDSFLWSLDEDGRRRFLFRD